MRSRQRPVGRSIALSLVLAFSLAACGGGGGGGGDDTGDNAGNNGDNAGNNVGNNGGDNAGDNGLEPELSGDAIQPSWAVGDTFWVRSIYRGIAIKDDEALVELLLGDADPDTPAEGEVSQNWSAPIYWEYHVLQADWTPEADSTFHAFATDASGAAQPITIIQVTAPKEINGEALRQDLDPVFFIVIRQNDLRVRAVHYNYRIRSRRNSVTLEFPDEPGEQVGSDKDYFLVPYLLPRFPIIATEHSAALGEGREQSVGMSNEGGVLVDFFNGLDNGVVSQRWEQNLPWFSHSFTRNRRAWLMSFEEVLELSRDNGNELWSVSRNMPSTEAIAAKFRRPIDVRQTLVVEEGEYASEVSTDYKPWAGYWWSQKGGALIHGWQPRHAATPSQGIKESADALLTEIEGKRAEIFEKTRAGEEIPGDLRQTYFDKKRELESALDDFYKDFDTGLDGKLARGELPLEGLANWSTLDKWALFVGARKASRSPFEAARWEFIEHYNPAGPGWWGHCNGWTAAAILIDEPREPRTVTVPHPNEEGQTLDITFEVADLKGLANMSYFSSYSLFYGQRYNSDKQDIDDLHPDVFHRLITHYIGQEKFPLAFDITAGDQVWNYPAYAYEMSVRKEGTVGEGMLDPNTASEGELAALEQLDETQAKNIVRYRGRNGLYSELADLAMVMGIDEAKVSELESVLRVGGEELRWSVVVDLKFTTDGVAHEHIDADPNNPEGFTNHYTYDLFTDAGGKVRRGVWTGDSLVGDEGSSSSNAHPDFAWLPYANNRRPNYYRSSENPHIDVELFEELVSVREYAPRVCRADGDCEAGQTCFELTGECIKAEGCSSDADCAETQICDVATSACIERPPAAACSDAFEGNQAAESAAPVSEGSYEDLQICDGQSDWFAVELTGPSKVEVLVSFEHAAGDLDAALLAGPEAAVVDSGTSTSDDETLAFVADAAQTIWVRVFGYNDAVNSYGLLVTVTAIDQGCSDDATTSGADAAESAVALDAGSYELAICGSEDWIVYTSASGSFEARIDFTHTAGDLDLAIFDAGLQRVAKSTSISNREAASIEGDAGSEWYIRVYGYSGAENSYTLQLTER